MTKTNTKPKAGTIEAHREREAEAAIEYTAARAAADAAAASIPDREAAAEAAEEHVEEIRASWAEGLDIYTADDLNRAQAEVERTTALLAGARSSAAREGRSAKSTDTDVAEIVAAAIGDVYDWLPTVPTFLEVPHKADGETAAYVVQTKPTKRTGLGVVSGAAQIAVCLDRRFRPLTRDAMVAALAERGHRASVDPSPQGIGVRLGNTEWSHWRVKVDSAHDVVPFIAVDPTDATARSFGASMIARSGRKDFQGAVASANSTVSTGAEGTRTTTLSVLIVGHFYSQPGADRYASGSSLWDSFARAGTRAPIFSGAYREGEFVEGLGIVESVEISPEPDAGAKHQTGWHISATFTSRTA